MRSAVVLAADGGDCQSASTARTDRTAALGDVVDQISPVVDDVVVSCPAERTDSVESTLTGLEYRLATDSVPNGGPIAAIRSGCRVARSRWTFVMSGTVDSVRPALVDHLFEAVEGDGVVVHHRQPLVGVYDTEAAIEAAETTLGMGSRALTDLRDRLDVTAVDDASSARASSDSHEEGVHESGPP